MTKRHLSDSDVQCNIEKYIFDEIKKKLLCENLQSNVILTFSEENDIWICPDFYSEKDHIIGEIHTHLGRLKPAQLHKIEGDILKMLLFEKGQKGVWSTLKWLWYVICRNMSNCRGNSLWQKQSDSLI